MESLLAEPNELLATFTASEQTAEASSLSH
jgi:hypothetical protein